MRGSASSLGLMSSVASRVSRNASIGCADVFGSSGRSTVGKAQWSRLPWPQQRRSSGLASRAFLDPASQQCDGLGRQFVLVGRHLEAFLLVIDHLEQIAELRLSGNDCCLSRIAAAQPDGSAMQPQSRFGFVGAVTAQQFSSRIGRISRSKSISAATALAEGSIAQAARQQQQMKKWLFNRLPQMGFGFPNNFSHGRRRLV